MPVTTRRGKVPSPDATTNKKPKEKKEALSKKSETTKAKTTEKNQRKPLRSGSKTRQENLRKEEAKSTFRPAKRIQMEDKKENPEMDNGVKSKKSSRLRKENETKETEPRPANIATRRNKSKDQKKEETKPKETEVSRRDPEKVPIYLQKAGPPIAEREKDLSMFNLKKRKKSLNVSKEEDIYNLNAYGEEEFGPQPENKKRRRKKAKKQPGDIILTFGQKRENVAPILKEIKNLKTPQPLQQTVGVKKNQEGQREPLKTVGQALPLRKLQPPNFSSVQDSPPGFSRDCDDFLPSMDTENIPHHHDPLTEERGNDSVFELPKQVDNSSNSFTKLRNFTSPSGKCSSDNILPSNARKNKYKTPMIPRHVRKREGKVSTPRPEEKPKTMTTQELVKISFGFESEEETDEDEGESLLDFSGISHRGGHNRFQSSTFLSPTPMPSFATQQHLSRNLPPPIIPYRFDLFHPTSKSTLLTLPSKIASCTGYLSPNCTSKKKVGSNAKKDMFVPKFDYHPQQRPINNGVKNAKPNTKNEDEERIDLNETSQSSLFSEVEDKNEPQKQTGEEPAQPMEFEMDKKGMADVCLKEKDNEVTYKKEKQNAFAVMKVATDKDSIKGAKRSCKVSTTATKSPKIKQTSIKKALQNLKNKKMKPEKHVVEQHTALVEGKKKQTKPTKTYTRRASFDSTFASNVSNKHFSPAKRPNKQEKEINNWASLTTSHFSEVEDCDLSFV